MSLTVLHLAANRWWTGSADPVIQLASGLRARGHRVLLGVIPGDRFEAKAREAGFDIVPGLDLQARFQPFAFMRDVRRLSKVVAREGVDVIHCHHSHDHWLGMLIRDARDDRLVPVVARHPQVREVMRTRQRELAEGGDAVIEGRDIGTVVCPDADVKIYLNADRGIRAQRRKAERPEIGADALATDLRIRDQSDAARMQPAADAVQIDTTDLDVEDVVDRIEQLIRARQPA